MTAWEAGAEDALNGKPRKQNAGGEYDKGYTYVVLSRALRVIS